MNPDFHGVALAGLDEETFSGQGISSSSCSQITRRPQHHIFHVKETGTFLEQFFRLRTSPSSWSKKQTSQLWTTCKFHVQKTGGHLLFGLKLIIQEEQDGKQTWFFFHFLRFWGVALTKVLVDGWILVAFFWEFFGEKSLIFFSSFDVVKFLPCWRVVNLEQEFSTLDGGGEELACIHNPASIILRQ